jgi:hypothetical protein
VTKKSTLEPNQYERLYYEEGGENEVAGRIVKRNWQKRSEEERRENRGKRTTSTSRFVNTSIYL